MNTVSTLAAITVARLAHHRDFAGREEGLHQNAGGERGNECA